MSLRFLLILGLVFIIACVMAYLLDATFTEFATGAGSIVTIIAGIKGFNAISSHIKNRNEN